jgi:DNA-binding NarL/FixJ family response regulator
MTHAQETRVVLADRPGPSRTALARLVADTSGVELVAKVSQQDDIEPAVQEWAADVVIVDDRLLRNGRWTQQDLGARLIVVGVDDDPGYLARARRIGAEAWIPKERADALLPLKMTTADAVATPERRQPPAHRAAGAGRESLP